MWVIRIHHVNVGSFSNSDIIRRVAMTDGGTPDKAVGKIAGVQGVTIVKRDTTRVKLMARITENPIDQTLKKSSL